MKTSSGQGEIFAFFALLRKIAKRNEFASLRFASLRRKTLGVRFAFASQFISKINSLSQSTFGQNLDPCSE